MIWMAASNGGGGVQGFIEGTGDSTKGLEGWLGGDLGVLVHETRTSSQAPVMETIQLWVR
jgi:hypothetical protein